MDYLLVFFIGIIAAYAAILATYNFLKDRNDGEITDKGVISPNGKDLLEKQNR